MAGVKRTTTSEAALLPRCLFGIVAANSFNFVNMVKLKLKPATLAKEGFHPTSKVPIVIRAKHLVIKGRVTRKFKLALANELECRWIR